MKKNRLFILSTLLVPLAFTGCEAGTDDAGVAEDAGDTGDTGGAEDPGESETGEQGPIDTDQDGLTDEEEAELGTDPNLKDTDADNYWDSWEIIEGTDPLDLASRIYTGFWPYNPDKDDLEQGTWETASTVVGKSFPRDSFLDQHGDDVDLYDFTNFTYNESGEPAYFIFDLSAQWCGPCHNVANWIAGVDNQDTGWIQDLYPTVRDKVKSLRIWWITFVVEDAAGNAPTLSDAESWFQVHKDNHIPILVDDEQKVRNRFLGPAFPHFFLLTPDMKIEYFPPASGGSDSDPYPAVGLVDKYL
jgi:hypothetical protein